MVGVGIYRMTFNNVFKGRTRLIGLIVGMSIPLIYFIYWFSFGRNPAERQRDAMITAIAERNKVNPPDYRDMMNLMRKVDREKTISDRDWKRVKELYNSKDGEIHAGAIGIMMALGNTSHRTEILNRVRPLLNSPDPVEQSKAMTLLWRFKEPDWHQEALARSESSDPVISFAAHGLLEKKWSGK
jgi:hypothetical protein